MKTFHVHLRVKNLQESITFYNALFNKKADVLKKDYAKWILSDPRLNFAISTGHNQTGVEHLGFQTDSQTELDAVFACMKKAKRNLFEEGHTTCCYSKSKKSWVTDPQGVDWEAFYTYGTATVYGEGNNVRPAPSEMETWKKNETYPAKIHKKK
ncbi:VOC family protein [Aquimarina aggregata]|uniref:VOC family protein n=1 Tax=Aquimarina aggregata TaxID=1642818 RepID=UPI0024935958|nr:VOC family protein [Aquimarina aggregata]